MLYERDVDCMRWAIIGLSRVRLADVWHEKHGYPIKCNDFKSPSIRGPIDSRKCDKDGTYVCVKVLHVYRAADMWSVKHKLHSSSHSPLAKSKFPMEGELSKRKLCPAMTSWRCVWVLTEPSKCVINVLCCMLIYPRPIVIVDCPSKQAIFISHSWHHHFCWASIPLHYPCTLQRFYITSNHGSKFALNFHFLGTALDMCLYFSLAFDCPQFLTSWMEHLHHCSIILGGFSASAISFL